MINSFVYLTNIFKSYTYTTCIICMYLPKGGQYALFLGGGLVKAYPWRIWVIIDTLTLHVIKGGARRLDHYKWSSNKKRVLGLGSPYHQQSCGRWCLWVCISPPTRTLQGVTTLPVPKSAVSNNDKIGHKVLCPHFGSYFDVIFLMYLVSSGFSFKPTSSSPTQFSQEWVVSVQKKWL